MKVYLDGKGGNGGQANVLHESQGLEDLLKEKGEPQLDVHQTWAGGQKGTLKKNAKQLLIS